MEKVINHSEDLYKKITVVYSLQEVEKAEYEVLSTFREKVKLAGFRSGKAPHAILRRKFKKDIYKELRSYLIREAHQDIGQSYDFKICTLVGVEDDLEDSIRSVRIIFDIEIFPNINVENYKGISVKNAVTEVTDSDVDQEINRLRGMKSEYKIVDRPIQQGDYVKVTYTGTIDDKNIQELVKEQPVFGTQKNTWEIAGGDASTDLVVLTNGLIDMKKGDTNSFIQDFDSAYWFTTIAGKSIKYHVEVHEIRESILPDLDNKFFQSLEVQSIEALKDRIKGDLKQSMKNQNQQHLSTQILEALLNAYDFQLPKRLIEEETRSTLEKIIKYNVHAGMARQAVEEQKDVLVQEATAIAKKNVRMRLILLSIAAKESLEIDNEMVSASIYQEAMTRKITVQNLVKEFKLDPQYMQTFKEQVLCRKTVDFLIEKASLSQG